LKKPFKTCVLKKSQDNADPFLPEDFAICFYLLIEDNLRNKRLLFSLFILLVCLPLQFDKWLVAKIDHNNEVDLTYECSYEDVTCEADFNNDGTIDHLVWDRTTSPAPDFDSWLVITDGSVELFRLPCRYIDNDLRTHVAIRNSPAEGARFLVFDGVRQSSIPTPIIKTVFAWNGQRMVGVTPTALDQEILTAMESQDFAGTLDRWSLYLFFRWPILMAYGLLLTIGAMLCRRFLPSKIELS
jgi:hypothetical protein